MEWSPFHRPVPRADGTVPGRLTDPAREDIAASTRGLSGARLDRMVALLVTRYGVQRTRIEAIARRAA